MHALDIHLFRAIYDAWGGKLTGLALFLSLVGGGWAMLLLVPLYAFRRFRPFALSLSLAVATGAGLVFCLKQLVSRERPCVLLPGVHALCAAPTDPSFPSGHACGSFIVAAFVGTLMLRGGDSERFSPLLRVCLSVALIVSAAGIAWSRVYLGVHFPGDVGGGAVLGTAVGAVAGRLSLRKQSRAARDLLRG